MNATFIIASNVFIKKNIKNILIIKYFFRQNIIHLYAKTTKEKIKI